jgi:hypothetical protein
MLVFELAGGMPGEEMPEDQEQQEQQPQDPLAEIIPLKKYYLSQKLIDVKNRLFKYGIQRDDLELIIQFQNELSYNVLLNLSDAIISGIEEDIERLKNAKQ